MKYKNLVLHLSLLAFLNTAYAQEAAFTPEAAPTTTPMAAESKPGGTQVQPEANQEVQPDLQRETAAEKKPSKFAKKISNFKKKRRIKKVSGPTEAELANTPKSLEVSAPNSLTKSEESNGDETPLTSGLFSRSEMRDPGDITQNETGAKSAAAVDALVEQEFNASAPDDSSENSEDTPVALEEIQGEKYLTPYRPWRAPNYANQEEAIGYTKDTFSVPKGLEIPYKFWLDIYTKYTTDQGVLHDAEHMEIVYDVLDFTSITRRGDINIYQKEHLKLSMVKSAKKRVEVMLKKFSRLKDPGLLGPEELKFWKQFETLEGKTKFILATKKNRLRFQLGQKDRIVQGIYFSGRYIEDFEKTFREMNIPIEMTRLVYVESSFNVLARSKVGASGLWQLMPGTARPYMMINEAIDKRNHPQEAAKVAAKLLKFNYKLLQSWPLAVTGWNHGPNGILRLTKKYKTREIGDLVANVNSKKSFGFASQNFYASFLAVLEAEKNAPKYFGALNWSQPLDTFDFKLPKDVAYKEIKSWFDDDDLKTQIFNPHINKPARLNRVKIPKGAIISIPKDAKGKVPFLKEKSASSEI